MIAPVVRGPMLLCQDCASVSCSLSPQSGELTLSILIDLLHALRVPSELGVIRNCVVEASFGRIVAVAERFCDCLHCYAALLGRNPWLKG